MAYDDADERGLVRKLLHWAVAFAVLAQVVLGGWAVCADPNDHALKMQLFQTHDGLGATILVLVLLSLALRFILGVPALPPGTPRWVDSLAHFTHRMLYLVLIVQPVLGYLATGANGHPWSLYGLYAIPSVIDKNPATAELLGQAHQLGAALLIVLVALHLLGAFYHGVIRRDGVVRRIV